MTTYLTGMRNAIWDAVNNWTPLTIDGDYTIQKKFRYDNSNDGIVDIRPAYTDLTAIAIWPGAVTPDAWVNRAHRYPSPYDVIIWTKDWNLVTAEETFVAVVNAIYKSGPDIDTNPTQTYIRNATGHHPTNNGPYIMDRIFINDEEGGQKAIRTTWTFTLQSSSDPYPR